MKKLVTEIARKHGYDPTPHHGEQRLRLEFEGFPSLLLIFGPETVCVAQGLQRAPDDGEWSGEWDEETDSNQEVLFHTGDSAQGRGWVPMYSSQRGICHFYARPNRKLGGVELREGQEKQQAEEARRCQQWALELREQGWLERGTRPPVAETARVERSTQNKPAINS